MSRAAVRFVSGTLLALVLAVGIAPAVAAAAPERPAGQVLRPSTAALGPRTYRPPTGGRVVDPFRPPPSPWLPGNRGIEYATDAGSDLVAIGPGVVAFAGQVAGRLVVSIVHPDGLRSALTGVGSIEVEVGDLVLGGELVAIAGDRVHLGVRRGETYLDPASLWGAEAEGGRAVLVPVDGADHDTAAAPRVDRAPPWRSLLVRWPW